MSKEVKAVEKAPITVNNYNRYCETGDYLVYANDVNDYAFNNEFIK